MYQEYAREHDRTAAELIREAMAQYRTTHMQARGSLLDMPPLHAGRVLCPLGGDDDLLDEMLGESMEEKR
jgi:hypothetical protein